MRAQILIRKLLTPSHFATIGFLLGAPLCAHLLFSWMGFNPTDDGFTLAYSRRILENQVPHRDFIIIRPFLSPLMHTPVVLLGGDFTFWISRGFVWFQMAVIAWSWTWLINQYFQVRWSEIEKSAIAVMIFATSAHSFPIMAWHTIDGLFLASIGLVISRTATPRLKFIGYVIVASAYLCKQSFVLLAPLLVLALGDSRKIQVWFAVTLPGVVYIGYLFVTGALPDALVQLTSQTGITSAGLSSYLVNPAVYIGAVVGYLGVRLAFGSRLVLVTSRKMQTWLALALLGFVPTLLVVISLATNRYLREGFALFGMMLGIFIYWVKEKNARSNLPAILTCLVLLTAWSVSLSIGYNLPILAAGQMLAIGMAWVSVICQNIGAQWRQPGLLIAAVLIASSFGIGRTEYIYRDQRAKNLTHELEMVLPGGKWIKTNPNTRAFLDDLNQAIAQFRQDGKMYAILPDAAGYWVQSSQINPLPIDWAQDTELNNPNLVSRAIGALDSKRGKIVIVAQKVHAATLADGFTPIPEDFYPTLVYVRARFTKIGETRFFEIYQ